MEKESRIALIQRSLGLRHKLKVLESMKQPDNHEDLALALSSRWEYEDELRAVEDLLNDARGQNVASKKTQLLREYVGGKPVKKKAKTP